MDEEVVPVLYVEEPVARSLGMSGSDSGRSGSIKFEPGFPWFVSVARGNVRLYLSEHKGDARPNTLIHLYFTDIDTVAQEFGVPIDEEGLAGRECTLEDPDGNRLRVATRRP
jgi:hypothetical protein